MSKKRIGLYLGLNSVGGVALDGKRIIASAKYDLASLEEVKGEGSSEDIRWEALINKVLREIGADSRDVYITITDKDFIFRSLDMPMMDKKNIGTSLVYEIEKYIPFKIAELQWDYDYIRYPKEKKITVSFVGIRENNIYKIKDRLSRLNLESLAIEPASLSLVKTLKSSKKFSSLQNFAILDITETEAYLTFFYQELPVFNQYIVVPKKGDTLDVDKFVESVRFAFQYFKREFKSYELEKLIVMSNRDNTDILPLLKEDLQIDIEVPVAYELTGNPNVELEILKAYGTVNIESPYRFRPVLKKTEEYAEALPTTSTETPWRIGILSGILGVGLLACITVSILMGSDVGVLEHKLRQQEQATVKPKELKGLNWQQIEQKLKQKEADLAKLKSLTSTPKIADALAKVASLRPKGLWFENLDLDYRDGKFTLSVSGFVFLGDAYNERSGVDNFISNLKKDTTIKANFSKVELVSLERKTISEYSLTYFIIRLN